MSLYKQYKTDVGAEQNGITLRFVNNSKGAMIEIDIARSGGANTRFAKVLEAKTRPYRRQIQTDTIDPKVAEELYIETFAETVVLGWRNMEDENCNDLPFSKENCIKVLKDLPDLFAELREQAGKAANFRAALLEADLGNS